MSLDKKKWIIGKDGLFYSINPNASRSYFVRSIDEFGKNVFKAAIPFSKLPSDVKKKVRRL